MQLLFGMSISLRFQSIKTKISVKNYKSLFKKHDEGKTSSTASLENEIHSLVSGYLLNCTQSLRKHKNMSIT